MKLEKAFEYRTVWMGLAAVWVVWFHSTIIPPGSLLLLLKEYGYGGVDIFMFASGIGCYYSLAKNDNAIAFLKRRFVKIFPTYWCFISLWLLFKLVTSEMPVSAIIGNVLCVQNFSGQGYEFDWYTGAICWFYLLTPLLYRISNRLDSWKTNIGFILFLFICSLIFWGNYSWIIVAARLPIFFIGILFGKMGKEGSLISKWNLLVLDALVLVGIVMLRYFSKHYPNYLWSCGLDWYPFILIVPGFCISVSYLLELMKDNVGKKFLVKIISTIGKYSFEIYLLHMFIFELYGYYFVAAGLVTNRIRYQLCAIALLVPGCVLLNKYKSVVLKMIFTIKDKCKMQ